MSAMRPSLRKSRPRDEASAHGPVVSRLSECHARIRTHLGEARALATGVGTEEARRASATAVVAYFERALPLHAADEDLSVAPHLPADFAALTTRLAAEHAAIDRQLEALLPTWKQWAAGELLAPTDAHRANVERLAHALEAHLAIEEAELFAAIEALAPALAETIVGEMLARRR